MKAIYISPGGATEEVEIIYELGGGDALIAWHGPQVKADADRLVRTDTYADFDREVARTASCGFKQARDALDEISRFGSADVPLDELEALIDAAEASVAGLGIASEAGEVADLLKKHLGHGHELDREKLKKELGDVLWYVARIAQHFGMGLEDVARANVAKLRQRYPSGFSTEASKRRADIKA